jgi:hypothetical protein
MGKVLENAAAMAGTVPEALSAEGLEGETLRAALGPILHGINVPQFAPAGLNFGYYYDASPIIAYDGEAAPTYDMGSAIASTAPGCRAPHFRLPDGASIYDRLGPDYTLLRFDRTADTQPLATAAEAAGVPLVMVDCECPFEQPAYRHALLIVRQDQHVAWRGEAAPTDPAALMERLRGARCLEKGDRTS